MQKSMCLLAATANSLFFLSLVLSFFFSFFWISFEAPTVISCVALTACGRFSSSIKRRPWWASRRGFDSAGASFSVLAGSRLLVHLYYHLKKKALTTQRKVKQVNSSKTGKNIYMRSKRWPQGDTISVKFKDVLKICKKAVVSRSSNHFCFSFNILIKASFFFMFEPSIFNLQEKKNISAALPCASLICFAHA